MDSAAPQELRNEVVRLARSVPGVAAIEKCRVRKAGLEYYVDIHVGVDAEMSVREGHRIAHRVKDAVREAQPAIADVLVHIEPIERDAAGKN